MFRDRQEAAERLAARLRQRVLHDPLVLAIPRGGVLIGATLALELHADLDVILTRKLRAPGRPDLALGALAEDGTVYLDPLVRDWPDGVRGYLEEEKRHQGAALARSREMLRAVRPRAPVAGRSVIITDDGIATGSTMLAVLDALRGERPRERIVAVPVCPPDRVALVRRCCDDLVHLAGLESFTSIGAAYIDFHPVSDQEVRELLRQFAPGFRAEPLETA
jgi:predicted phosphoribosyltransferase